MADSEIQAERAARAGARTAVAANRERRSFVPLIGVAIAILSAVLLYAFDDRAPAPRTGQTLEAPAPTTPPSNPN
jgi:hypothetical protein